MLRIKLIRLTVWKILPVLLLIPIGLSARQNMEDIVIGKQIVLRSKVLKEDRPIFIRLPENYKDVDTHYPVLYVLDADWYFAHTAALVSFLSDNGRIPPMIVIGIPNTNRDRDFSHVLNEYYSSGRGIDYFQKFVSDELIPHVDAHYRTTSYRILKGWCATGFFCLYTLFNRYDLFDAYIAATPYVIEDDDYLFEAVTNFSVEGFDTSKFLFFTVGDQDRPDLKSKVPKFAALLNERSFTNLEWDFTYLKNEDHYSIEVRSLYLGLERLFAGLTHYSNLVKDGIDEARIRLQSLAIQFGFGENLPEETLNTLGYLLVNQERFQDATVFFQLQVEAYPDSWNAYDSLGESLLKAGDEGNAIQNYRRSLELNPQNKGAKDILNQYKTEEN